MQLSNNEFLKYKKLTHKKFRNDSEYFIVEGIHLIQEALKFNLLSLIITSDESFKSYDDVNIKYTTYKNICSLSSTKTPQEYVGICKKIKYENKSIGDKILVLNKINDPGNLGTLIRTAISFGYKSIVVEGVDIYNPKVIRSTQGAIFYANIFNCKDLKKYLLDLKNDNFKMIGSILDKQSLDYRKLKLNSIKKYALILGNEASGIDDQINKILDYKIYIPINFESLNVAIAGGILMAFFAQNKED